MKRVSENLRQLAINKGIQIDDFFRNENGIGMQMIIMISVIENKKSPLHSSPKLFNEIVEIYKSDKTEFYKILREAKTSAAVPDCYQIKNVIGGKNMIDNAVTQYSNIEDAKNDFVHWMQNNGSAQSTIQMYISAIRQTSKFAIEYDVCTDDLFIIDDINEIRQILNKMLSIPNFQQLNAQQNNRFSAAISKLIDYRFDSTQEAMNYTQSNLHNSSVSQYADVDFSKYRDILKSKFTRGFRLNDNLDIKKFRRYWNELYNEENILSNETLWDYIGHITIAHGKISYVPEAMINDETKNRLLSYIDKTFADGKNAIYYEALYQMFRDDFDNSRINNAEMLKTYLEYMNNDRYSFQRTYIAISHYAKVDPVEEVRSYLKSHEIPMATDDIVTALSHLDKNKVISALSGNGSYEFVWNQTGEYFHADIIEFTEREITKIEQWISASIAQNEYMSGKELTDLVTKCLPEIYDRYCFLTELGLRNTIAYKLREKFSFKSKIISKYGEDLNMDCVFASFAKSHTPFTIEQLSALARELGTNIYFESVYENAMRINQFDFVSRHDADFDISTTDDVIEQFCTGNFVSLQEITLFGGFPSCGFSWNIFLLEYYVAYFSQKFKLLHTKFNMNSSVGAIVRRNSEIETFDDVITIALAKSNVVLNTDNALNYLCDSGFIARRKYGTIDAIVKQAKSYRAAKGE